MRKTRYLVLAIVLFIVAIALGWSLVDAAPQSGNGSKSRTQMDQQTYNDTYGTEQVIILGQIATTPQTTNGSKSITQIAQQKYNATYGANQVVLSTSTGKQVPFTNLSSLTNGDILRYDSTGEEWVNEEGRVTILTDAVKFAPETDSTTYLQVNDADGGTPILNVDATNERVGIGTASPNESLEVVGNERITEKLLLRAASGTTYRGIEMTNDSYTPIGSFQSFVSGGANYLFFSVNRFFNGTAWSSYNATAGSTIFMLNNAITFYRFAASSNATLLTMTLTTNGDVGINAGIPIAKLDVAGSKTDKVRTIAASTGTIAITDRYIIVDYTATGTVALTLPAASTAWNATDSTGIQFMIKDLDANAGSNAITISRAGSDTIVDSSAGQTSTAITTNGGSIWIGAVAADTWIVY